MTSSTGWMPLGRRDSEACIGSRFGQIFISDTNRESLDRILDRLNNSYNIYSVLMVK